MNVVNFIFFKYLNFILLFIRGYLISYFFSYENYATWGVVMFIISYHSIAGFGIPKIILTKLKDNHSQNYFSQLLGTSIFYIICLSLLYIILYNFCALYIDFNINSGISIESLIVLSALLLINASFLNAARYKKLYKLIIICETISIIPLILFLLIFGSQILVIECVYIMIGSTILSIIIYSLYVDIELRIKNVMPYFDLIKNLGIPLLFFNYASYFTFILLRYFVLNSYNDEIISYFNFGWFIGNAIIMGISTITWYFYPMLLKNLKNSDNKNRFSFDELFYLQLFISFLIFIIVSPLFEFFSSNFYEKYQFSLIHFKYILASQLIFYLATYPSSFLIANDKKKGLIISGILSGSFFVIYIYTMKFYENIQILNLYIGLIIASLIFLFSISYNVKMKGNKKYFYISSLLFARLSLINYNFSNVLLLIVLIVT
jgi:hypothetical protein